MDFIKSLLFDKKEDNNDKIFLKNVAISGIAILMCIVALCSSSWAWFQADASTEDIQLVAGKFDLEVSITDSTNSPVLENARGVDSHSFALVGGETYTVVLSATDDSTLAGGYCKLSINGENFNTEYISTEQSFSFTICLESDANVSFEAMWGIPSYHVVAADQLFTNIPTENNGETDITE